MGFKIRGKNFQAWEHFELEAAGLTVLIGPSNEGKTSIFRAVKGVVRNELSANHVRVGTEGMELILELDGHVVKATRRAKGSTKYEVDEAKYEKLDGAVPEGLAALGLNEIHIGDVTLDPVFAVQDDPQFMIREKPTPLNAILGAFASTEKLEQGKREANRRIAEKTSEARVLAAEHREAEALQARLTGLAEHANDIQIHINLLGPQIRRDEEVLRELEVLIGHRRRLKVLKSLLSRLEVPSTTAAEDSVQALEALTLAQAARKRFQLITAVVAQLELPDISQLASAVEIVEHAGRMARARKVLAIGARWFTMAEEIVVIWTTIVYDYRKQKQIAETVALLRARATSSAPFYAAQINKLVGVITTRTGQAAREQAVLDNLTAAIRARAAYRKLAAEQKAAEKRLAVLRSEQQSLQQEIDREQNSTTCPKCGEVFLPQSGDRTLTQANPKEHFHA